MAKQRASQGNHSPTTAAGHRSATDRSLSLPPDTAEPDRKYRAVLDWVWSFSARPRTPDEIVGQRALKLERMRVMLRSLGNPEVQVPTLLVAGTKGKGSTVAMLASCLRAAGLRTGRYTSPHLVNWRERIWLDGEPITTDEVMALAQPIREAIEQLPRDLDQPTTFEVGTAFAFLHFAQQQAQIAVIEVGVGGRYDATNVAEPLVSAITPISYDHTQTLGATLTSIAEHKAGIMRADRLTVLGRQRDEARQTLERVSARVGASLQEVGRDWRWQATNGHEIRIESSSMPPLDARVGLLGNHQRDNATTAVAVLHGLAATRPDLGVRREAIQHGLSSVDWPGRLQVLRHNPWLIVDGAHNAASAEAVAHALEHEFKFKRLLLVLGLTLGKDAEGVLHALAPRAEHVYLTRSHHERSADPLSLAEAARRNVPDLRVEVHPDLDGALRAALKQARPHDMVLVTGSLFLVGEALIWWANSPQ